MKKDSSNISFSLPMWASMLLLPCFLIYFVHSEFQKEKKTMLSQKREKAFENIFSKIDTLSTQNNVSKSGNVIWVKDTTGTEISYKLSYVSDSISIGHENTQIEINTDNDSSSFSFSFDYSSDDDQTIFPENKLEKDTTIFISKSVNKTSLFKINSKDFSSNPSDSILREDENFTIIQIIDEDNKPSFVISDLEINNLDILKSILPQIGLSLLLLLSVWLSFYLNIKSMKKERQLTELRNDFMSNMTHELKTPVSTISVALEALSNFDAANDKKLRKEYIDISRSEIDRLGMLVDKALNISLYEQGKFIYNPQELNLDLEIQRIIKTLDLQLSHQNVTIEYQKSGSDFNIFSDKTHITNVIHNLIENGVKYSNKPTCITIRLLEDPGQVIMTIKDNGIGISDKYIDKIFDKFFRVPSGNKHNTKGHGLGLSYVKEVILNQNGSINVKSKIGEGTSFIITLPKLNFANKP